MSHDVYKETMNFPWGRSKLRIKGKMKGTLIYKEQRDNSEIQWVRHIEGDEDPILESDYLIFDIPDEVNPDPFYEIGLGTDLLTIRNFNEFTEIACKYPDVFSCGILSRLQELGYVEVSQLDIPNEKGKYPMYANASGWKLIYNAGSLIMEGLHRGVSMSSKRTDESHDG